MIINDLDRYVLLVITIKCMCFFQGSYEKIRKKRIAVIERISPGCRILLDRRSGSVVFVVFSENGCRKWQCFVRDQSKYSLYRHGRHRYPGCLRLPDYWNHLFHLQQLGFFQTQLVDLQMDRYDQRHSFRNIFLANGIKYLCRLSTSRTDQQYRAINAVQ